MKKYPRLVQCDARGQIVIPKDIRRELDVEEGTGFFVYAIDDEGILLKKISRKELSEDSALRKLEENSEKISLSKKSIKKAAESYKRTKKGNLEIL